MPLAGKRIVVTRPRELAQGLAALIAQAGGEEEPHWNVVLEGIAERLPVSRRQWSAVRALVKDA